MLLKTQETTCMLSVLRSVVRILAARRSGLARWTTVVTVAAALGACSDTPEPVGPAAHGPIAADAQFSSSGTLLITSNATLVEDHYGNISIAADNVTLDCAGHTVFGPGVSGFSGGIEIDGHTGVTVTHCTVTGFGVNGIFAGGSSNGRYEANTLSGNGNHGIHLDFGSGNVVVGNMSRSNGGIGIVLTSATQSRIDGDTVQNNTGEAGIVVAGSNDNVVVGNTALRNSIGFVVDNATGNELRGNNANQNHYQGFQVLRGSSGNTLDSNTVNQNLIGIAN